MDKRTEFLMRSQVGKRILLKEYAERQAKLNRPPLMKRIITRLKKLFKS